MTEQAHCWLCHAAVVHGIDTDVGNRSDRCAVIDPGGVHRTAWRDHDTPLAEILGNEVPERLAVETAVIDDRDAPRPEREGEERRCSGTLCSVVADDTVEDGPTLLRERRVRGRGGDHRETGLFEDRHGRLCLAGETRADDGEDLRVVDDRVREPLGDGRVSLGVEDEIADGAVGVRCVVAEHRKLGAVLERWPTRLSGERAEPGDGPWSASAGAL